MLHSCARADLDPRMAGIRFRLVRSQYESAAVSAGWKGQSIKVFESALNSGDQTRSTTCSSKRKICRKKWVMIRHQKIESLLNHALCKRCCLSNCLQIGTRPLISLDQTFSEPQERGHSSSLSSISDPAAVCLHANISMWKMPPLACLEWRHYISLRSRT